MHTSGPNIADPKSANSTNPTLEINTTDLINLEELDTYSPSSYGIDACSALKNLCLRNLGCMIIGHLNINSIRNKFDALKAIASHNLDILMVAETNIDDSFPKEQLYIEGCADPLRHHRDGEGAGFVGLCERRYSNETAEVFSL